MVNARLGDKARLASFFVSQPMHFDFLYYEPETRCFKCEPEEFLNSDSTSVVYTSFIKTNKQVRTRRLS